MREKIINLIKLQIFRNTGIYTVSSVINKAIPFLLLPILTRFLSTEEYGIISMFGVVVSVFCVFVGVNTQGAIARNYYELSKYELSKYIFSVFNLLLVSISAIIVIIIIFGNYVSGFLSVEPVLFWFALIIAVSRFLAETVLTLWQIRQQATKYGFFNILNSLLNVALSIIFVVFLSFSWKGRIYGMMIASILFALVGMIILLKNKDIKMKFDKNYFVDSLKFGFPLIPHAIGSLLITMGDRFLITELIGIDETGVYSVGYQIGMIINVLTISFNQAYIPWLYGKLKIGTAACKRTIVKITYIYIFVVLILAIVISVVSGLLMPYIVGEDFISATPYIIWVSVGYSFHGMYFMVSAFIFYSKKTKYLGYVTGSLAIINLLLNYFFIPVFGALGAAYATTIVYVVEFIVVWSISSRIYKMPWNLKIKIANC